MCVVFALIIRDISHRCTRLKIHGCEICGLDLDVNFPADIPDPAVAQVFYDAWLAEHRKLMAEYNARYTPEERLEQWKRDHANDTPFVM